MKKFVLFRASILMPVVIIFSGLTIGSCSKDDLPTKPTNTVDNVSRADAPEVHWRCRQSGCGFLNAPWRSECLKCGKAYNPYHGGLLVEYFQKILKLYVGFDNGKRPEDMNDSNIQNRIIIPGGILLDYAPTAWYDTYKAQTYYNKLKTLAYYSDPDYAAGVDLGWYRTVRMLYPGVSDVTKVQSIHDRWLIGDGRFMKDQNGRGLKDGTKAAIDAFANR